jgi:hypothetical protein
VSGPTTSLGSNSGCGRPRRSRSGSTVERWPRCAAPTTAPSSPPPGRWAEAEDALLASARGFSQGTPGLTAVATTRLALLRVRQGMLDDAEALLDGLDENPDAAVPLAAMHLARGRNALARDRLERTLAEPSLRAGAAGPLLALLVDVELQSGDTDAAAAAASRLESLARATPTDYMRANAALARGKLGLATATGDPRACRTASRGRSDEDPARPGGGRRPAGGRDRRGHRRAQGMS